MNDVAAVKARPLKARYVLHERLGAGGQGEVWRARDPQQGVDIALKILRPGAGRSAAAWDTLLHEHECANRLEHPNILKVFPPERDETTFLLPMELAPGGDLRRLRGANYLAIVPVLLDVARALEHAHERGVIHRDLKPGNVLFDARGQVKLADFGVSGRAPDAGSDAMIRGLSPFTASPEQLRGEPPTPGDDIYGLGALAYELLSRYPPHYPHFDAQRVQQEPAPPLVPTEQIPPQLGALIARMLAKNPKLRPASMREVIEELEASLNDTLSFDFETAEPPREAAAANATTHLAELAATQPPAATQSPAATPAAAMPLPAISSRAEPIAPPPRIVQRPPAMAPPSRGALDGEALWEEVRQAPIPARVSGLEPMRSVVPRVVLVVGLLTAVALAAFIWLPRYLGLPGSSAGMQAQAKLEADRTRLEGRIAALEARGALLWGGANFAAAKTRAAESVGARDGGSLALSQQRLDEASQLLDAAEGAAPAAPSVPAGAQVAKANRAGPTDGYAAAAGEGFAALGAGRLAEARAAFERARALRPNGAEAVQGLRQVNAAASGAAIPAPASGTTPAPGIAAPADTAAPAEAEASAGTAAGTQASGGAPASAASAASAGTPAPPNPAASADTATAAGKGFAAARSHALDLEAQERWEDAARAYNVLLRQDRSLTFAQEGKSRAEARLDLDDELQAMLDRPDRIANSQQAREQARAVLQEARAQPSPGPVLSSQIERLSALLPDSGKPVHVALVSDSVTQVEIPSVGTFGSFSRRDIELRPGRYTVIGTRDGYREVRRDIVVSPEHENLAVNVSCSERI